MKAMTLYVGAMKYLFRPLAALARNNLPHTANGLASRTAVARQAAKIHFRKAKEDRVIGMALSPAALTRVYFREQLAQTERSEKLAYSVLGICGLLAICYFLAVFF